jgi:hypothetical protein
MNTPKHLVSFTLADRRRTCAEVRPTHLDLDQKYSMPPFASVGSSVYKTRHSSRLPTKRTQTFRHAFA